jgi:Fic family protein
MKIDTLEITPEMLSIISELDQFKGNWQLLGHISLDYLRKLKKIATIESVGSSTRIEGPKLSDAEVEALLSRLKTQSFQSRDEEEVAGYGVVCDEIFSSYQSIPLTENYIKQLLTMLLSYSHKDERHRGNYKKLPNHVEAFDESEQSLGIIFSTATPFETPLKMEELIDYLKEKSFIHY